MQKRAMQNHKARTRNSRLRALSAIFLCAWFFQAAPSLASNSATEQERRYAELAKRVNSGGTLSDQEMEFFLQAGPVEKVEVRLLTLAAQVLDRNGSDVHNLQPKDFTLLEDGKPRPVNWVSEESDRPARVVMLFDVSESMDEPSEYRQAEALLTAVLNRFRNRDFSLLISFSDQGITIHGQWTQNPSELLAMARTVRRQGRTAILDALREAARQLSFSPLERQAIILITDGADNESTVTEQQVKEAAAAVDVPVYALLTDGIARACQEKSDSTSAARRLRAIAEETGGRILIPAGNDQVEQAAETIRHDLCHQYWLGYQPSKETGRERREIQLQVNPKSCKKCRVLTRRTMSDGKAQ